MCPSGLMAIAASRCFVSWCPTPRRSRRSTSPARPPAVRWRRLAEPAAAVALAVAAAQRRRLLAPILALDRARRKAQPPLERGLVAGGHLLDILEAVIAGVVQPRLAIGTDALDRR